MIIMSSLNVLYVHLQVNDFLTDIEGESKETMSNLDIALGFIKVANESMCRPIRALTQVTL